MINHKTKTLQFFYRGLIQLYKKPSHTPQGYMLFLIISLSITLSGLLVAYAILAKVYSISVKSAANSNSGFYGAEGALNTRAEQLRSLFINYLTPTGTAPTSLSACMDADTTNNGSGHFACQSQTFAASDSSSNGITAYSYVVDSTSYQNGQPPTGTVPPGESFQNLNMLEYRYSINSVTQKANASSGQVTAMTEMAIKSRLIPMFQFAAFYLNDLEILPGPVMNLSGPIHTNGNLYLGSDNGLNINSQVTLSKNLYSFRKNNNQTYPDGRVRIMNTAGTFLNLLFNGTGSTSQTTAAMDANRVATAWGSQVKLGIDALSIPNASILDLNGDYSQKADLKILYTPTSDTTGIPFEMTSISRSSTGSINSTTVLTEGERRSLLQPVLVSKNLAGIPNSNYTPGCNPLVTPFNPGTGITLTPAQRTALTSTLYRAIVSLKTPYAYYGWNRSFIIGSSPTVVTSLNTVVDTFTNLTTAQRNTLKNNLASTTIPSPAGVTAGSVAALNDPNDRCALNPGVTLTDDQKAALANALYIVMVSQTTPIPFNEGKPSFSIGTSLNSIVDTFTNLTSTQKDTLKVNLTASNPTAIAALDGRFFVSAPIQDIGRTTSPAFRNDREARNMRLLQINIESLAIWNKVGRSVAFSSGSVTDNNSGLGFSADQRIFATANADSSAIAGSFQNLGLAGSDTSEGGFVFHATINKTTYTAANGKQSPYGFVLVQAQQLPGLAKIGSSDPTGLTFVSDQAVYVQGDYNTVNWQPASILADSLNVLSNACLNTNFAIHKLSGQNCNTGSSAAKITPTPTTINSAFLAGTDITNSVETPGYNGGLENYPRFLEQWGGVLLTYRGSFVSTSTPLHVSGAMSSQLYTPPARNWEYDTQFNAAENLPPLAPRFVYLKQESFTRNYNQ
jgi:hypothetical protein